MKFHFLWIVLVAISSAMPASASEPAAPAQVEMKSLSYSPKTIEVSVGQPVVWANTSLTEHSASGESAEGEGSFDTGMIEPGKKSKPVSFSKAGDYRYHCHLHGKTMSGEILVKAVAP